MKIYLIFEKNNQKVKVEIPTLTKEAEGINKMERQGYKYIGTTVLEEEKPSKKNNLCWTVRMAYNDKDLDIDIGEDELAKVMFAFKRQVNVITNTGAIRGRDIISITPNNRSIMGWNAGYQLQAEDYAEIAKSKECILAKRLQSEITESIRYINTIPEAKKEFIKIKEILRLNENN